MFSLAKLEPRLKLINKGFYKLSKDDLGQKIIMRMVLESCLKIQVVVSKALYELKLKIVWCYVSLSCTSEILKNFYF